MAEILGTAASVVSLIGAAVTIIQQIETAQRNIKGASKTFDDVSGQLDDVCQSLYFVKKEPRLQTSMIGSQIRIIIKVAEDLKTFLEKLHVKRRMKFFPGLVHALKSGEEESKQLVELLSKLDRARAELVLRISVTHIALTGDLKSDMSLVNNGILEMTSKVDYLSRGEHTSTDLNLGGRVPSDDDDDMKWSTSAVSHIPCLRIDGKTGGIRVSGKAEQVITGIQANTVAAASINGDTGTVEANNVQCAVTGISVKPSRYHKYVSVLTAKPR